MIPVKVSRSNGPLVLAFPHCGTYLPSDVAARLNDNGRKLADTDWHVDRLYDGLIEGASTVSATHHRYVIDVNRDPSGGSLYPGQNTTALVPLTDFDGRPIWVDAPDDAQSEARCRTYHAPYHAALQAELDRVRAIHGVAILFDCHSIRSQIPFLFPGTLPDMNIGTNGGTSCAPQITAATMEICEAHPQFSTILDGRFKGGWTTRHYGQPESGIHAIQMELAQIRYLQREAPPWDYDETKAAQLRAPLSHLLQRLAKISLNGDLE